MWRWSRACHVWTTVQNKAGSLVSARLCICKLVSAAATQPVEGDASVSSWASNILFVEPVLRTERFPGALKMVEISEQPVHSGPVKAESR